MPVDKQMQSLVDGWYFADESFAQPGVYFWNGKENVHAQTELSTLRSDNNRLRAEYAALQESVTAKDLLIVSLKEQNAQLQQSFADALLQVEELEEELRVAMQLMWE